MVCGVRWSMGVVSLSLPWETIQAFHIKATNLDRFLAIMIVSAVRECLNAFESFLTYFPYCNIPDNAPTVMIKESTYMVDGIGGGVWEGALIVAKLLEVAEVGESHRVIELGCGAGLSGIVAALHGANVIITDREVDLAEHNIRMFQDQRSKHSLVMCQRASGAMRCPPANISASELLWGEPVSNLTSSSYPDVIIGAEITCLRKQQDSLARTIDFISGPLSIILLSFDDLPAELPMRRINGDDRSHTLEEGVIEKTREADTHELLTVSKYEREMDQRMKLKGYNRAVICTARVDWRRDFRAPPQVPVCRPSFGTSEGSSIAAERLMSSQILGSGRESSSEQTTKPNIISYATIRDISESHYNDLGTILFPSLHIDNGISGSTVQTEGGAGEISSHTHHISAYYRPSATSTCSRCHASFFYVLNKDCPSSSSSSSSSSENSSRGLCRHHKSMYVCRYDTPERGLSENTSSHAQGGSDSSEDVSQRMFWDCCGLSDRNAPGCQWSRHVSY